ncbi:MAG: Unknown protein [uncultured Campylobacterales bacterium]|uniref:Uncharacterized protein n=1 Tax=uncultured Campylobacterales bacterium TaxID=352960 RepID=A0A6S6SSP3_9BACT|nr:MAG: Unknown protein [uncultured Campylobacterales bacterium]
MLKVYITCLASYNHGTLIGKYVELPCNDLQEQIQEVLNRESSLIGQTREEYFITNYEWNSVSLFQIGEYHNVQNLNKELKLIEDFDENALKVIKFLLDESFASNIEEALEQKDNVIVHKNQTMKDYAKSFITDCFGTKSIPSIIVGNIDYEGVAKELGIDGSFYRVDNDIYEYNN